MDTTANPGQGNMQKSMERYHKMVEEVEDYAIILLDTEGNIRNWNRGAEKIKGYTADEIIGQNFRKFYFKEDILDKVPEKLINLAATTGKAIHEGWRRCKDNTRFWGSLVITAIHDDENNIIGFIKVTRDLTEKKIAEDQIRQYAAELEIKNKELSQFVSIASHDLQEPLRKIGIFSGFLKDSRDNREASEKYIDKISASTQRMSNLIKEGLRYSLLSNDEMWANTDLNTVIKTVLEDYELTIAEKNAIINYPDLPTVNGITIQLQQLFANIIGNALKFSTGNTIIDISVNKINGDDIPALKPETKYYEFSIKDNGSGFSAEYREKIFNMFQRLDPSQKGTGIGLALCKKIIENHSGHIKAESEPGNGTTITFYLPE